MRALKIPSQTATGAASSAGRPDVCVGERITPAVSLTHW